MNRCWSVRFAIMLTVTVVLLLSVLGIGDIGMALGKGVVYHIPQAADEICVVNSPADSGVGTFRDCLENVRRRFIPTRVGNAPSSRLAEPPPSSAVSATPGPIRATVPSSGRGRALPSLRSSTIDSAAARHPNLRVGPLPAFDARLLMPTGDLLQVERLSLGPLR